ncbi:MAG TPA: NAD(P)-binding protein [Thermodesulfobacteriota bacterium]|jgi:NADPH-dependent glutamate synthase beta subunit-like oxidoreductase|nr:NAD(P)-binding protein [Thermodesulfobacteriota bacterium]
MTKMTAESDSSSEFVIPISYGSSEITQTGKWGFQKPDTVFKTAPCQEACPTGINIAQFLYLANEGMYGEALLAILKESPFPGVCGRVCFHPCELNCNRTQYDESVSIHAMERYVSDATSNQTIKFVPLPSGESRRVAIIGAGPAGLSCAYFLSLLGHRVSVFEARKEPGGVMRWGIPGYRLPKSILKREIRRILSLPIELRTGIEVGKAVSFYELGAFDAVFVSPGAQIGVPISIPGEKLDQVWKGREFLDRINSKVKVKLGKETIVIGGGNTAMDVARSALRLGSRVTVAYRRTRNEMPAIQDEIEEAEVEGIQLKYLIQPVKVNFLKTKRLAVKFQCMKLSSLDQGGRPKAIPIKGKFITLETDHLIAAVGEQVDLSWLPLELTKNGLIEKNPSPKIFAGGDAVDQARTIVTAIGGGKRAAISIDSFFRGHDDHAVLSKIRTGDKGSLSMETYLRGREKEDWPEAREVVPYEEINTLFFEPSRRIRMRKRNRDKVLKGFSEVNLGYNAKEAKFSASRCFSCGTCNYCYNCYYFCPEGVISLDPAQWRKEVDFDHCKGCGTCAKACPRSVVEMREYP